MRAAQPRVRPRRRNRLAPVGTVDVGDALASWAKQAQSSLLQALAGSLKDQSDPLAVLAIRHKMLSKYFTVSAQSRSDGHGQTIDDIRAKFDYARRAGA